MNERKQEMRDLLSFFDQMPDRLAKYLEILLLGPEASPYSYQDTMSYRRLAVSITTCCNLNCIWCYRHDPMYHSILNKQMEMETLRRIIDNTRGRFRLVHLVGTGEPLMYPPLDEAIRYVRQRTDQVKITTNGTLLSRPKIDDLVRAGLTHIEVSIDSFSAAELRRLRGSDLETLVGHVEYMANQTPLSVQVNSVVSSLNYDGLFEVVDVLKNAVNLRLLHTIPLFMTEPMRSKGVERISDPAYKALLEHIEREIRRLDLPWRQSPSPRGVSFDPIIELKRRRSICFTCFEDPYIDIDGFLCVCGRREFHPAADAREGFEKAMNSPALLEFRKQMLQGDYPEYCGQLCYLKEKPAAEPAPDREDRHV